MLLSAIIYHIFIIKEPLISETKIEEKQKQGSVIKLLTNAFVTPILGMKSLITKKRKSIMKFLIFLQLLWFSFYWLTIEIKFMLYLYMRIVFSPFEPADYSEFTIIINLCNAVCLMIIVPILSQKLKIHDSMLIAIILVTEVVSFSISPFVKDDLWQFYIVQAVGAMGYCKYSTVRSMISKCIEPGMHNHFNYLWIVQPIMLSLMFFCYFRI